MNALLQAPEQIGNDSGRNSVEIVWIKGNGFRFIGRIAADDIDGRCGDQSCGNGAAAFHPGSSLDKQIGTQEHGKDASAQVYRDIFSQGNVRNKAEADDQRDAQKRLTV